jgi:hypothetical protein
VISGGDWKNGKLEKWKTRKGFMTYDLGFRIFGTGGRGKGNVKWSGKKFKME